MNDTLKNIFQTLSENAEENFIKNKNAEDYLAEDGLWHCGKCGTAKQFRLPERFMKMGMPEIVGCCCACQSAKEKRENAKQQLASVIRENKENGSFKDAYLTDDRLNQMASDIYNEYGSTLLYGPVAIPEFDSEVYGFLAADGDKLEDVWYGIWHAPLEDQTFPITKITLFD